MVEEYLKLRSRIETLANDLHRATGEAKMMRVAAVEAWSKLEELKVKGETKED